MDTNWEKKIEIKDCVGPRPDYFMGTNRGFVFTREFIIEPSLVVHAKVGAMFRPVRLMSVYFVKNVCRPDHELLRVWTFGSQ